SELLRPDGVDGEDVAVVAVPLGRGGAAELLLAVVVADVGGALGQPVHGAAPRSRRQLGHVGRDVEEDPVPETAPGRGVRVVAGDRVALGLRRRALPTEM